MDAMNDIQKIRTQIEQHQAEQEHVLRRTMSVPEKKLREKSYSLMSARGENDYEYQTKIKQKL